MNPTPRYDVKAVQNIMEMLRAESPGDYARLKADLVRKAGGNLKGMGQNDSSDSQPGFWQGLLNRGVDVLGTVADYKLQEQTAKAQQKQYNEAVQAEMARQAMLAEQAKTQQMEYVQQLELARQQSELERAADKAKGRFNVAMYGVAGLLALWLITRLAT